MLALSSMTHWRGQHSKPFKTIHPPKPSYWDSTTHWKIYKINNFDRVFRIPIDSLQWLQGRPLKDASIHSFLSDAKKLPAVSPLWMGCYLTSYQAPDGSLKKAIISHYAGFFYCQLDNNYFQLDPAKQNDWLTYLSDEYVDFDPQNSK
jgi:hypothetical protein